MKTKILLINPLFYYFPGIAYKKTNYLRIPLGLCYLASYIRSNNNVHVEIIDASALGWGLREIENKVDDFKPDIVGISVVTPNVSFSREVITLIKNKNKNIFIFVGGPHITAIPEELLDVADVAIRGEGEKTFSELISCFESGKSFENVEGIVFKSDGVIKTNSKRAPIGDLDSIPFAALDLLDLSKYKHIYPYKNDAKIASILTSRGCPYDCFFCGNDYLWGGIVRYRSIPNVINEIRKLKELMNISLFWIDDDIFGPESRVRDFCNQILEKGLDIQWLCHLRCDSVSKKTLCLMKRAGCIEIQAGVESGNEETLKKINKKLIIGRIKLFFKMTNEIGINTWATFIFGLYDETEEQILKSIKLAKEINPTYATFIHLLPFPGTKIFKDYSKNGYIKTFDWSRYNWHSVPIFETEFLSLTDLVRLKRFAYLSFYLRPLKLFSYILQSIRTGSWRIMLRNLILLVKLSLNI